MAAFEKCEDLACHSIQELMREAFKKKSQSTTASEKKDDLVVKPVIPKDCPLDRESLGQSVWAMVRKFFQLNTKVEATKTPKKIKLKQQQKDEE